MILVQKPVRSHAELFIEQVLHELGSKPASFEKPKSKECGAQIRLRTLHVCHLTSATVVAS